MDSGDETGEGGLRRWHTPHFAAQPRPADLRARFARAARHPEHAANPAQYAALSEALGETEAWFHIRNAVDDADAVDIYLYDEIGYWGVTAGAFVDILTGITAKQINLRINSPGGEVFDGLAIFHTLRSHPANVTSYVDGLAASAASFIALAGNEVRVARNSIMMIHDAAGLCWGQASDMRSMADVLDKLSDNIADIYAQRGGTVAEWRERMLAETWYTGNEAVEAGLADEVTEPDDPDDEPEDRAAAASASSREAITITTAVVAPDVEPAAPAAPTVVTPAPPADEPEQEPTATWSTLTDGLLATIPPPTVDGLFARLREALSP